MLHPDRGTEVAQADRDRWIAAHQRPQPRLDAIAALWQVLGADADAGAIAVMDSSDGLANAVLQLCQASRVGAVLREGDLPLDGALVDWVGRSQALGWCLYGGEDFELVLCLPWPQAEALQAALGNGCAIVGETTRAAEVELWPSDGATPQVLSFNQGFQHFG